MLFNDLGGESFVTLCVSLCAKGEILTGLLQNSCLPKGGELMWEFASGLMLPTQEEEERRSTKSWGTGCEQTQETIHPAAFP